MRLAEAHRPGRSRHVSARSWWAGSDLVSGSPSCRSPRRFVLSASVSFKDLSDSINHIVQATAVAVGGGWAFMKYVRGRTFRYRAKLNVIVEVLELNGAPSLQVHASMQNQGLSKIDIRAPGENAVIAYALPEADWLPDGFVEWRNAPIINHALLFEDHFWVEPGETIEDDVLIPVGGSGDDAVVYRLQVRVIGRRRLRIGLARAYRLLFRAKKAPGALGRPSILWTENLVVPHQVGARGTTAPPDPSLSGRTRLAPSARKE